MEILWEEPPWSEPLDAEAELAAIPDEATVSGFLLSGVRELAKSHDVVLEGAQASYLAFKSYPTREHAGLMVECARRVWPALPLRQALRKIGRGAAALLIATQRNLEVESPTGSVQAMARSYGAHMRPGQVEVLAEGERRLIVRMREVHYFVDSHHVGVFEGVLRHAKVDGKVRIAGRSAAAADMLLEWT